MSFSVTPTNRVDIDMTNAGPDDFLALTLENGSRVFLHKRPDSDVRFPRLALDEQLLPPGFEEASVAAARKLLRDGMSNIYVDDLEKLKTLYDNRADPTLNLRRLVALEIRRSAYVSVKRPSSSAQSRDINIGEVLTVVFGREVGELRFSTDGDEWVAPSPIKKIEPIARFGALLEDARYGKD